MAHRLASPFLTTVATAATMLAATGCGTTVVFDAEGSGGDASTSSASSGQGGTGQGGAGTGGSDPLPCPADKPLDQSPCAGFEDGRTCEYVSDPPCPEFAVGAVCDGELWNISEPECNPPPPLLGCEMHGDPNLCDDDPSCRWIVPGCGDNALDQARCFPAVGCDQDPLSCTDAEICAEVSHHPCWGSTCQACHMSVFLCLGDDSDV